MELKIIEIARRVINLRLQEMSVQVPHSVLAILETQKVNYNVANFPTAKKLKLVEGGEKQCLVKAIIMQDSGVNAQILIPADHIIDPDAMFRQFGRKFDPLACFELRELYESEALDSLPAIPNWQGMTTYIDSSLIKHDQLLLEAGAKDQFLEMTRDDFGLIITSAKVGSFCTKAPVIPEDTSNDESQIQTSVQKFTEKRIRQRLDETLELPTLPETAQNIIRLRADPNADISDLTNVVEIDPSLSAQVVSWAASPYYSAPGKIRSVHDAIVRVLGFDMVLNLALGLALGKTMSMDTLDNQQVRDYWRASVYNAAVVEAIVTSIDRNHRPGFGMAYLSGLMHNFGTLVMAEVFPPYFHNIQRLASCNPHLPRSTIEYHLMGVSGNQIAAWLLENWSMPAEVVTAIRHQNSPHFDGEHHQYAKLVHLSNQLLAEQGIGDRFGEPVSEQFLEDLHIDVEKLQNAIENIIEAGDDLDAIADKLRG